ncbi:MAG: tRNA (adenosine(37)-N6)-threonylcarbamoyltransferase complex ATPase subunit type 1 TsaE [Opitutales bacterium]
MRFEQELRVGVDCPEPEDMVTVAAKLAPLLPENITLLLDGEIGVGKTYFVASLAKAFGVAEPVTSPTYDLVATYRTPCRNIIHVDAFRIEHRKEVEALGVEDLLASPWLLLVEWAANAPELHFGETWRVLFETLAKGGRRLRFERGLVT